MPQAKPAAGKAEVPEQESKAVEFVACAICEQQHAGEACPRCGYRPADESK